MKKLHLLILLLFTSFQYTYSQSPPFKQFKTSDGLPSPDVYDCMQDSEGYMWFATENGISRFDSYSFQNYSKDDGLNSNTILSIVEKDKHIYIGTLFDGINVFNENKISNLNFKRESRYDLHKIVFHKDQLYNYFPARINVLDGDSSVSILYYIHDYSSGKLPFIVYRLHSFNNEKLLAATSYGLYVVNGKRFEKLKIEGLENEVLYFITSDKNNNIYASGDNIIYKIAGDKITDTYKFNFTKEKKVYRMLIDPYGSVWFSVLNEGLFRYSPVNNHLTDLNKKLDTEKLHVNAINQDSKNNIWICTFGKGVFCFYNTFINNYNTKDGLSNPNILSVTGDKNQRLYCGTYNGLSVLEKDSFTVLKSSGTINSFTDYIRTIKKVNDSLFVVNHNTDNREFYSKDYKNVKLVYTQTRCPVFISTDTLLGGSWDNFISVYTPFIHPIAQKINQFIYKIGEIIPKNLVNDLLKDSKGIVWSASDLGISIVKNKDLKFLNKEKLSRRFKYLKEDKNGFVWACGEKGLFILKDTNVVFEFSEKGNENITGIEFNNEGHAWLATVKGIYGMSVYYDEGKVNLKEEYLLNENAGLASNDISSLYYEKTTNILWAGTSSGLTSVNLDGFEKQLKDSLPLRILSIGTTDAIYNLYQSISFPEYVNDIKISVSSFDINSTGNLLYKYKLNKEDIAWNSVSGNIINFPSLAYGDYDFQIYAANSLGKVSDTSTVSFKVETPFIRSYFFYAIVALSAMGLTGFAVSRSSKKKYIIEKERNTFKNQISDLKQRSLVSMMNPHFVFNSLNSIQSFYNYKENESANEYLAKFSRLIRMNLDYADKTFIKLSDELERLESYLTLEKMRFDENLKYEIWVSDDIDPEKTEIPNMIIQPFVENAIWHGILKSQNAGKVTVNIFHSKLPEEIRKNYQIQIHSALKGNKPDSLDPHPVHCIKIEIIDNGIGIKNCQKNKTSDHISRGISVIKERLSILHHYAGETELVKITDRSELPDPESGTIVEIYLTPNICKVN